MPLFLLLVLSFTPLVAQENGPDTVQETLTLFKFENLLADTAFNHFNHYLAARLEQDLRTGFVVKVSDRVFEPASRDSLFHGSLRIALYGRFEKGTDSAGLLRFKIHDVKSNTEEEKIITVNYMEKEDIAQIILLKTRSFLSRSILGTVAVTSSPLGMAVFLDGKPQGKTPREFFLKTGGYALEISGEHFEPYREDFAVVPGRSLNLGADMEFKGWPTKYWLLGAAATTWELMVVWFWESNNKRDDNVRYARLTLLSLSGIGWIGTGFCYLSNKSLKNMLFKHID
jgi:hypothetical protein